MIIPKPSRGLPPFGWIVQPKWNGVRYVVESHTGEAVTHGGVVHKVAFGRGLPRGVFDGELVGDTYHVFDVLTLGTEDVRYFPIEHRLALLHKLGIAVPHGGLEDVLEVALPTEGIVAKRPGSAYPGVRTSRDWFKWRWTWGTIQ